MIGYVTVVEGRAVPVVVAGTGGFESVVETDKAP